MLKVIAAKLGLMQACDQEILIKHVIKTRSRQQYVCNALLQLLILETQKMIIDPCYIFCGSTEAGGGSYNWMAPSLQSQDLSFTVGSSGGEGGGSVGTSEQSSLLFSLAKMKPPKRPLRPVGDSFGKGRLKPDDSTSTGGW